METSIGSVARMKEFSETTESETEAESEEMVDSGKNWPQHGGIEFRDI